MAKKPIDHNPPEAILPAAETSPAADAAPASPDSEPRLRQGNAPICPYCSKKNEKGEIIEPVMCKSVRSDAFFTRYYCPTEGCPFSEKVARPQIRQRVRQQEASEQDFSAR
jgi:hypothetical protein